MRRCYCAGHLRFKEKAEKLLGNPAKPGYLKKGVVSPDDAYVIAVNGYLLRSPLWMSLDSLGISGFTFAVEATFCVEPRELRMISKRGR